MIPHTLLKLLTFPKSSKTHDVNKTREINFSKNEVEG